MLVPICGLSKHLSEGQECYYGTPDEALVATEYLLYHLLNQVLPRAAPVGGQEGWLSSPPSPQKREVASGMDHGFRHGTLPQAVATGMDGSR